jgi:hypothetical protein
MGHRRLIVWHRENCDELRAENAALRTVLATCRGEIAAAEGAMPTFPAMAYSHLNVAHKAIGAALATPSPVADTMAAVVAAAVAYMDEEISSYRLLELAVADYQAALKGGSSNMIEIGPELAKTIMWASFWLSIAWIVQSGRAR